MKFPLIYTLLVAFVILFPVLARSNIIAVPEDYTRIQTALLMVT